jgi:hypothetical protein
MGASIFFTAAMIRAWEVSHVDVCGNNLDIATMCAISPMVHTSDISSCQKNYFSVPAAVNNSIKVGP